MLEGGDESQAAPSKSWNAVGSKTPEPRVEEIAKRQSQYRATSRPHRFYLFELQPHNPCDHRISVESKIHLVTPYPVAVWILAQKSS